MESIHFIEVRTEIIDFRIDGINTLRIQELSKIENDLVTIVKINI